MDPQRYAAIKSIAERAFDLEPDARPAFLASACPDADVRAEVMAILDADAEIAGSVLYESPIGNRDEPPSAREGSRLGPYELKSEIGHGGMGTVFLAKRADRQFEQTVAVKVVRGGFYSHDAIERFTHERRVLARLNHPGIASLIDGGLTDDGLPYFVMEYVEGLPIDEFARTRNLAIPDRLRLFLRACEPVQAAHSSLVVHRDLKPSNILVQDDGSVKLLDFGIAKTLDHEQEAPITRTGVLVMTPEYAAPEQIVGSPVTVATDVYALGVVLYELLTGVRPFATEGLSAAELERLVTGRLPLKPSSRVIEGKRDPRSARHLAGRLAGDLDTIVLKALRKEPDRRYASVADLARDVTRHLQRRPVSARPDTVGYRASRFIRRHRIGVASVIALVLSMIAGLVATAWQARLAAEERDLARTETAKAEAINSFIQDMLASADPAAEGRDVTVAEILDKAAAELEESFADQPDIEAAIRRTLGMTYIGLGNYAAAHGQLERALSIRQDLATERDQEVAESLHDLGLSWHYLGEYNKADSLYRLALKVYEVLGDRPDLLSELATTINDHGTLLIDLGEYRQSSEAFQRAMPITVAAVGSTHADVASEMSNLGLAKHWLGDVEAADRWYTEALKIWGRLVGSDDHPDVAILLNNLAFVRVDQGDQEAADSLFISSLEMRKRLLGPDHMYVGRALLNLARRKQVQGRLAEADSLAVEALAVFDRTVTVNHPERANVLYLLGLIAVERANTAAARSWFGQALAVRRSTLPPDDPRIAETERALQDLPNGK